TAPGVLVWGKGETGCPATVAMAVPSGVFVWPAATASLPAPVGATAGQNWMHCASQVDLFLLSAESTYNVMPLLSTRVLPSEVVATCRPCVEAPAAPVSDA